MDNVASCQGRMVRHHDAGDHSVAELKWAALALSRGHQVRSMSGSVVIEGCDATANFFQNRFEDLQQQRFSFAGRHDLESKTDLEDGCCTRPHRRPRLAVQPANHLRIGCLSH